MKNLRTYFIIIATITSISAKSQIQVDSTGNVTIGDSAQVLKVNGYVQGNVNGALHINTGNGNLWLGPQNYYYCHINSDLPFAFNQPIISLNGTIGSYNNTNLTLQTGMTELYGNYAMTMYNAGYSVFFENVGITPYGPFDGFVPSYLLDLGPYWYSNIRANIITPSDSTLKTNIKNLKGARASLLKLQGVTYNLKPNKNSNSLSNTKDQSSLASTSSIKSDSSKYSRQNQIDTTNQNRSHIGFLAQDVQKIYPELVYKDKNGILSLDYIGLIPVMVESIKELTTKSNNDSLAYVNNQTLLLNKIKSDSLNIAQLTNNLNTITNQVASLTAQVNQCCSKTTTATTSSDQIPIGTVENPLQNKVQSDVATLSQNAPNPFNQNTTIGFYLPANVGKAVIYVYNLQGVQIKSIPLYDRGNGSIVVSGNSLAAGMYIYSLITDGNVIDTKRMILTN